MKRFTILLVAFLLNNLLLFAQVPSLSSLPSSQFVVYLDFDGEVINNTNWYASTIDAASSGFNNVQIIEVFNRVAEKYRPFDLNITTALSVFQAAAPAKRLRVVLTTSSSWYGSAGGVSFIGGFGMPAYEPAWVFVNNLASWPEYVADAAAHEIGHTLWLSHHGKYDASCNRTSPYHQGKGSGQTGWGPIMGAPYGYNAVMWYKGASTSTTCSGSDQDDLNLITTNNGFTYRPDDHGNSLSTATPLNIINNAVSDSGIISTTSDSDFFKFTISQVSNIVFNARPYSFNISTNSGATLHTGVTLMNNSGAILVGDFPTSTLNSSISYTNLSAGTYYIKIDGVGNSNYNDYGGTGPNDYGSLGRFYINGTITPNSNSAKPIANFNLPSSACAGESINCINTSTNNPTTYLWTRTGGTPATATTQNATFAFNTSGTYTVKLRVSNAYGSDSLTKTITVNAPPTINLNTTTASICINSSISLTATGANVYTWTPSTGLNITTGPSVIASPEATTTYTITASASNGCTVVRNILVTVNPLPGIVGNSATTCSGNSTTLSVSGANTYTWSPSSGLSSTTGSSVSANPSTSTTYSITGTNTAGCTSQKTLIVNVSNAPVLSTSSNTTICSGTSTVMNVSGANTYTWSPSTALSNTTASSVTANPNTSMTYTVIGTNTTGCSSSKTLTITVNPSPTLIGTSSASVCSGIPTTLTVSGANTYTWSPSTALNSTSGNSVTASPASNITYTVTGKGSNTCTSSKTVIVSVSVNPNLSVSSNTSICAGNSTSLIVGGANAYAWSPTTGLNNSTSANVIASPTSSITYTVTGSTNGCSSTKTVIVSVNALPALTTSAATSVCSGSSTDLSAGGASTYQWSPATGLNNSTSANVIASPTSSITYTVTGSTNGCSSIKTIVVSVKALPVMNVSSNSIGICSGASTALSATGATTYTWQPGTSLNSTSGAQVYTTASSNITYTVMGSSNGCTAAKAITVSVSPDFNLNTSSNTVVCSGNATTLTASGASTYSWSPSIGLSNTTSSVVTAAPTATTTYMISGTNGFCTKTKSIVLSVNARPNINNNTIAPSCYSINDGSITLNVSGGATPYSYLWNSGATTQNRVGLGAGTYNVTVTSANTCSAIQSITLTNPVCGLPVSVVSQNITSSSAEIKWGAQPCPVAYKLRYKLSSASTWTYVAINATNSSYTLSALTQSSTYQYQMQSFCNTAKTDSSGYTSTLTFTTSAAAGGSCTTVPTQPKVTNTTTTSAKLSWTAVGDAWGYKVRIRPTDNSSDFIEYVVQAPVNYYVVSGLTAGKSYKWNVMTMCNAGGSGSNWSTTIYFSTLGPSGRIEEDASAHSFDVQIYPNPTAGLLNCKIMGEAPGNISIGLYNVVGQLVMSNMVHLSELDMIETFDLSVLSPGIYILSIRKEQETINYRIIKQ